MQPRPRRSFNFQLIAKFGVCLSLLFFAVTPALADIDGGVLIRRETKQILKDDLTRKLRTITGWPGLSFDNDGVLRTGRQIAQKGSPGARALVSKAISGGHLIVLEDASARSDVVFSRVHESVWANGHDASTRVYVVLIDFKDFQQVMGDKQALAAFDVGWAVLHELDHVVEDSLDPLSTTSPGECEAHVNQMRIELGLPVRIDYFFSSLPIKQDPQIITRFVRLRFEQAASTNKVKRYWIVWDATLVGGIGADRMISASRP